MKKRHMNLFHAVVLGLFSLFIFTGASVYAHGGKQHGPVEFTHLEAVRKATDLFEKLLTSKKIDSEWEINLEQIQVFDRKRGEQIEIGVSFTRSKGDPQAVYIFFNSKGDYVGSNFTGD